MPFLDAQSRTTRFEPPDVYDRALAHYALSVEDVAFAKAHRRSHNLLVIKAIILWNTVYLSHAVNYVRGQGIAISDELLPGRTAPTASLSRSPTISETKLTDPSNVSGRSARIASIQRTSDSLSGYYCRNSHGAPICLSPLRITK
ncbi:Tn3 family transposase [Rhizobium binae]|nr:Tn3 family transposase [Rhizobium binae]